MAQFDQQYRRKIAEYDGKRAVYQAVGQCHEFVAVQVFEDGYKDGGRQGNVHNQPREIGGKGVGKPVFLLQDIAEDFVYEFTPMLLSGQAGASVCTFGNWQTYEMLVNLDFTLRKQGLLRDNLPDKLRFSFKYSNPMENWIQRNVQYKD